MFYSSERRIQLGHLMEAFDDHSLFVIVASASEDSTTFDFNIVSKVPPALVVDSVRNFMDHYEQQHMDKPQISQQEPKPHLQIVKDSAIMSESQGEDSQGNQ